MHLFRNQACADSVARLPNEKPAAQDSQRSSSEAPAFPDEDDDEDTYANLKQPWGKCIGNPWDTSDDDSDDSVDDQTEISNRVVENVPPGKLKLYISRNGSNSSIVGPRQFN